MLQDTVALDIALTWCAVMFFWLAAVAFTGSGQERERLALPWLGWFGLLGGMDAWFGLCELGASGGTVQGAVWSVPQLLASVCLVEFWARTRQRTGLQRRAAWAYFALLAMYGVSLALWPGAPMRWASALFASLAGFLAAWAVVGEAARSTSHRGTLWICAACIAALGMLTTALSLFSPFAPSAIVPGGDSAAGVAQAVRGLAAAGVAVLLWRLDGLACRWFMMRIVEASLLPMLLVVVILVGGFAAVGTGAEDVNRHRGDLKSHASMVAAALDREKLSRLQFRPSDVTEPAYLTLKSILSDVARTDDRVASVTLYAPGESTGTVGVVSTSPEAVGYLPPGSPFETSLDEAAAKELLLSGTPYVVGPMVREGKVFMAAHVPVMRSDGDEMGMALAIDVNAGAWARKVNEVRAGPLRVALLASVLLLGFFFTIRLHGRHEQRMRAEERRYRSLFESMQEGMVYCRLIEDAQERPVDFEFLDMNHAAEKLTGFTLEAVKGRTIRELLPAYTDRLLKWIDYFGTVAKAGRTRSRELFFAPRGRWFLMRGFSWERGMFVISLSDITERHLSEQEHRRLALHDPLTELPNRRLFRDRLDQAIAVADRNKTRCAVLYMDLNDFKAVNDTYGHALGDLVLAEVARRLKRCMRRSDTLARIGGDEFVAVIPDVDGNGQVATVSSKIQSAMSQPFEFDGTAVQLGVSIGVAVYPDHGEDAKTVLVRADAAMYQGKGDKNRLFVLYEG